MSEKKQSIMAQFSPKANFLLGFFTAILLGFIVGFFVLLAMVNQGPQGKGTAGNLAAGGSLAGGTPTREAPDAPSEVNIELPPVTESDHIRGETNAPIKIVEFSDFQCPFCARVHPTLKRLVEEYKGRVAWGYRHFPLESIHPQARPAAVASECVAEQKGNDSFWAYADKIFDNQASLGAETLERLATEVGADKGKFKECVSSGKYDQKVQEHASQAVAAGGRGTPHSIILFADRKIPVSGAVPFEQFKSIIDSLE